ncbi:uncharacterized protein LOC133710327 [Rosa rugosa]|uniref:uncharacterized protein LOC133710327 n=1 Tax=Rosa rugosa TaxID=74645 RepID=UPI002B408F60|nr:uncharacterized protein LOC133710327 [Rosa rugosa]
MLSCQIETEMDLNSETNLEMGIYMGLQRVVPQSLKLETRRLASLCERSVILRKWSFVHQGAIQFKGRHIVQTKAAIIKASKVSRSLFFFKVAGDKNSDYTVAKYQNSRI